MLRLALLAFFFYAFLFRLQRSPSHFLLVLALLSANGISLTGVMIPNEDGKGVWLALVMAHEEGFERRNEVFVGYGEDIKQFGARLSYMRRYMKTTILDVTADDDLDDRDPELRLRKLRQDAGHGDP